MTDAARPLPGNIEVEQALLGAILINNEAYHVVSGFLLPKHFSEPIHEAVYKALGITIGQGRKATPATLGRALAAIKLTGTLPEGFTVSGYVARLAASATTVVNTADFGRVILDAWAEREVLVLAQRASEAVGVSPSVEEQLERIEDAVSAIRREVERREGRGVVSVTEVTEQLREKADEVLEGKRPIASTGYEDIDKRLAGGCVPGRLVVVAGRPGMGKTVMLTEIGRHVARRSLRAEREDERFAAGIVTLEVDEQEITARVVAGEIARSDIPIPYRDIMEGRFESDRAMHRFRAALGQVKDYPFYIEYAPGASMVEIAGRVRMMKARARRDGYRLVTVGIDYLGLIKPSERYRGNQANELGEIALDVKRLAGDEEVMAFLGCQLNRGVEDRDDKRPDLSDLRGSGNIEEHSDVVAMLYREAYYLERSKKVRANDPEAMAKMLDKKYDLEVLIPKNRIGPTGTVHMVCDVSLSRVDQASRGDFHDER